jgi:integrase
MALPSYLSRREGRYYLQVRLARPLASLAGMPLYRASLRTADYRQARLRLGECMGWLNRMNESIDYVSLFEKNTVQLRTYLADVFPFPEERLVARRNYEELLKNLSRRAKIEGCDPDMLDPECQRLFEHFVRQNVDAEAWFKRAEAVRHYERGRADMQAAHAFGAVPQSFSSSTLASPRTPGDTTPLPRPVEHGSISTGDRRIDKHEQSTGESAKTVEPVEPSAASLRFSEALDAYEIEDLEKKGNADARSIVKLVVQFIIEMFDDPLLADFDPSAALRLDEMLPEIPNRKNIPREQTSSLATRYHYAQQHGWKNLERLTEARLRNGYHNALSRFFGWLIEKKLYPFEKPEFKKTSDENLVSIERDAFKPSEVKQIFSLPLFTGCKSVDWMWVSGAFVLQNHLYWGYVISFLAGLRPGELGRIELDDIEYEDGIYYLQLRGFDPKKGRVARKDVKHFKTPASYRTVPLHPLILDLGLLDRIADLRAIGCPVLFPEWQPYSKPGGEMRWGQPLTKSFQYLKEKIGLTRFDVTLYSSRHWFADLIDNTDIKDATRRKVMGHAGHNNIPSRYGRKQRLTTRDLAQLTDISSPVIDEMTELLLSAKQRADRGELQELKPWLTTANWSLYYKAKLLR